MIERMSDDVADPLVAAYTDRSSLHPAREGSGLPAHWSMKEKWVAGVA
jgi:hypothetical protein